MRARMATALVLVGTLACAKDRPVEAPVVDITVGDAGAPRLAAAEPEPGKPVPFERDSVVGRWEGIGVQDDGMRWEMRVHIATTTSGTCAVADYPSIPCRGEWICGGERGGVLHAREHLLDDSATRCIDNGSMTFRLGTDGTLEWAWTGQGQSATASLHRSR